jgi:hypothetical protein
MGSKGSAAVTANGAAPGQVSVFINYRRADTRHVAGRLRDLMVARFGEKSVFVDVEDIAPGADYIDAINGYVGSCVAMVVLIGDQWLMLRSDTGSRRIDDPTDRLRLEVEAGLRNRTRLIPVLVDDATMPEVKDLPPSLAPLARHHSARLRYETFSSDAEQLIEVIAGMAETPGTKGPTGRVPRRTPPSPAAGRAAGWVTVALLAIALLVVIGFLGDVQERVHTARPYLPDDVAWGGIVWLLPALPVALAGILALRRRGVGVAWGCVLGATVWVVTEMRQVADKDLDIHSAQVLLLLLLLGAAAAWAVAQPVLRARAGANSAGRAIVVLVLAGVALVLRICALSIGQAAGGVDGSLSDNFDNDQLIWIYVLVLAGICLPAAFLRLDPEQVDTLLTVTFLQVAYFLAIQALTFHKLSDLPRGAPGIAAQDLVLLASWACVLLAVCVGQSRSTPAGRR